MPIEPAPIVVEPSGDFLGDDGAWSTFIINAGSPPQDVQVLVSTEVASTWVVAPEGCGRLDALNCTEARGGAYDFSKSSTWNVKNLYQLGAENNLGAPYNTNDQNGTYGYDILGLPGTLGAPNVSVEHQVLAAIETKTYYVGNLGLSSQPINISDSSDTSPSFLSSLKNENLIPSLSFGYTAGASYRQGGVKGSLTLGGYDASRFTPNDVSFTFAPVVTRQLVVGLQSVIYDDSRVQTPLLSEGINVLVDSTVPYLWLPETVCQAFEQAFDISWNPISNVYLVNETLHDKLVERNASVVFQLADSLTGGPSINITLPYASFDLNASYPLVKSQSRYFPLQRANDDTQYTLGRTFFQESFLIVDYERSNFSISQAKFDSRTPSHIVAISSTTTDTTGATAANPTSSNASIIKTTGNGSHGIGTGAITGIAIAMILIATLIVSFFLFRNIRRRRGLRKVAMLSIDEPKDVSGVGDMHKHDFSNDPEPKKPTNTTVTIAEVPMTPPLSEIDGNEYFGADSEKRPIQSRTVELAAEPVARSELSSPEPWSRTELPSPDRSELSTPEPMWSNFELPTPDARYELPSPGISPTSSREASLGLGINASALSTPEPQLPVQSPLYERKDSSESEAGFTRDGMPRHPFHRHTHSNALAESSESDTLSPTTRPTLKHLHSSASQSEAAVSSPSIPSLAARPRSIRMDSSGSESSVSAISPAAPSSSSSPHRVVTFPSTFHSSSSSRPAMRRSSAVHRPAQWGVGSSDSVSLASRLESSSARSSTAGSGFGTIIISHQRGSSAANTEVRDSLMSEEEDESKYNEAR